MDHGHDAGSASEIYQMTAHFKNNPIVEQLPPKSVIDLVPYYRVAVKLTYIDRDGKQYDVPCGFETDGASVIRWLIWVIAVAIFALGIWTSELTPFSIGAKVVKNGSNFDVLLTRIHDGYGAVILPNVVAVSSGTYKIRCICSVGSGGGTVNIFFP